MDREQTTIRLPAELNELLQREAERPTKSNISPCSITASMVRCQVNEATQRRGLPDRREDPLSKQDS